MTECSAVLRPVPVLVLLSPVKEPARCPNRGCGATKWRRPLCGCGTEGQGGGGPQQAISSKVPSVVCKGTVTVWLMESEWFATGSQELWEKNDFKAFKVV